MKSRKLSGCWFSSRRPRSCFRLLDTDRDSREVDSGMTANQARSEAGLCLTPGGGLQRFNLRSQVNAEEAAVWQEYKRETGLFLICCQKGVCWEKWPCEGTLFTSTQGKTYRIYQGLNDELIIRMATYSLWWHTFLSTAAFRQFPVKTHQILKPEATYIRCSLSVPETSAFRNLVNIHKPLKWNL